MLKLLAPEQDQDRWLKGASSVLYTYVVFHKFAGVQTDVTNVVKNLLNGGQRSAVQNKKTFWDRLCTAIKHNLNADKAPLTWINPCINVSTAQDFVQAVAIKIGEMAQFTNIGNIEAKEHIANVLCKQKNVSETVAFAVNETANITDVRRRTSGLVRNAKAYKVPKNILGENLCHLIEHCECLKMENNANQLQKKSFRSW